MSVSHLSVDILCLAFLTLFLDLGIVEAEEVEEVEVVEEGDSSNIALLFLLH